MDKNTRDMIIETYGIINKMEEQILAVKSLLFSISTDINNDDCNFEINYDSQGEDDILDCRERYEKAQDPYTYHKTNYNPDDSIDQAYDNEGDDNPMDHMDYDYGSWNCVDDKEDDYNDFETEGARDRAVRDPDGKTMEVIIGIWLFYLSI